MENGLLYLFTTIAQALAGAIALLAAFALFRLQSIERLMADLCSALIAVFTGISDLSGVIELETLKAEGRYDDFIGARAARVNSLHAQGIRTVPDVPVGSSQVKRLQACIVEREAIRRALRRSALTTGIVMIASVSALPFAHLIARSACTFWAVAIAGGLAFAACIALYLQLIGKTLGEPKS